VDSIELAWLAPNPGRNIGRRAPVLHGVTNAPQPIDVVVIGAGQAGLSAAHHLRRRGFVPEGLATASDRSFVVLDANAAPGGAWQHRWPSLRMATVNGIHELPGFEVPAADPSARARDVLPAYFAEYEQRFDLRVRRPVTVKAVRRADDDPHGRLLVETDAGSGRRASSFRRRERGRARSGRTIPGRSDFAAGSSTPPITSRPRSSRGSGFSWSARASRACSCSKRSRTWRPPSG
jgi:glycine/D-amino acid oxidase-like deaminating enzyme